MNRAVLEISILALVFQGPLAWAFQRPSNEKIDAIVAERVKWERTICTLGNCNQVKDIVIGIVDKDGSKIRAYYDGAFKASPPEGGFQVASVTKTFTGTIIQELVVEGKINLDEPAEKYLPKWKGFKPPPIPKFQGTAISVRHLLTHTAGLPHEPEEITDEQIEFHNRLRNHYTTDQLYEFLARMKLSRRPGTKFQYSSVGFALLTAIISNLEGMSFSKVLEKRIFKPLGMNRTATHLKYQELVHPYGPTGKRLSVADLTFMHETVMDGTGAVESTAADLVRYAAAHLGLPTVENVPDLLQKGMAASHEVQFVKKPGTNPEEEARGIVAVTSDLTKSPSGLGKPIYLAMGWQGENPRPRIRMNGSTVGYRSSFYLKPGNNPVGVVVLANSYYADDDDIVASIAKSLLSEYEK